MTNDGRLCFQRLIRIICPIFCVLFLQVKNRSIIIVTDIERFNNAIGDVDAKLFISWIYQRSHFVRVKRYKTVSQTRGLQGLAW